jgi:hypothetical protein
MLFIDDVQKIMGWRDQQLAVGKAHCRRRLNRGVCTIPAWGAGSGHTGIRQTLNILVNDGALSVGRTAITAAAQGFMTAFPAKVVTMDGVSLDGGRAVYRWTLTGTNTGPGGTGKAIRIGGQEEWTFGADGLIAESKGHFDEAEYNRQLGK